MSISDTDDDIPQLSTAALTALQEFYSEQAERDEKLKKLINNGDNEDSRDVQLEENWQLSQFWYDDDTATCLSKEAIQCCGSGGKIALVSCPTLYKTLKKLAKDSEVVLFEYDTRFALYGKDFIFYDYKAPLDVPREYASAFDVVIADPPFLSEECLTKVAVTIKFLAKDKIILCTGAQMEDLAYRLLRVKKCKFEPRHKKNLANEFYCYTNYDMSCDINN